MEESSTKKDRSLLNLFDLDLRIHSESDPTDVNYPPVPLQEYSLTYLAAIFSEPESSLARAETASLAPIRH